MMNKKNREVAVVFDVDGVITDGTFWQSKEGKVMKRFGPDDASALNELLNYAEVCFITADYRGYPIVEKRFTEKGYALYKVSEKPFERWNWIKSKFSNKFIVYIGDGIYDWMPLENADYGMTTKNALLHVRRSANYISDRSGADRFVAEVCLVVLRDICKVKIFDLCI